MENNKIVDEFLELIKINSPSKNERRMADVLKQKLADIGCEVFEDDAGSKIGGNTGNIRAILKGTVNKSILLSAHMDRVDRGENIKPIITGDLITTDGTTILAADDVSGLTTILNTLRAVKASGKEHANIEVSFSICEEQGLLGSRNMDLSWIKSSIGYVFDNAGRIGKIINQAPYKAVIRIDVYGKSAHAGNAPETGVNAVIAAAKILADIKDGRLESDSTANFGDITTENNKTGTVCDHVIIRGETRSQSLDKLQNYFDYVLRHCEEVIASTKATCKVEINVDYKGFHIAPDHEVISTLVKVMEQMKIEPNIQFAMGGMDANIFNEYGIKCIGVSTGYLKNHTLQEKIYINDLIKATEMATNLIFEYSK